jgi:hypothetical protein
LPRPAASIPTPPTPPAACPPVIPWYFRPPIPILICPACEFLQPRDYGIPEA